MTVHPIRCSAVALSLKAKRPFGRQYFVGPEWGKDAVDVVARSAVYTYRELEGALDFLQREKSFTLAGSNVNIAVNHIDNAMATIEDTIFEMIGMEELTKIYKEVRK